MRVQNQEKGLDNMEALLIVGGSVIFVMVLEFIFILIDWSVERKNKIIIELNQFKLFYSMNPDAWELRYSYVLYKVLNERGYVEKEYKFSFPFINYIRYKILRKKLFDKKEQSKYLELYLEALEYIKKDIETFTDDNNDFIKEQLEKLQSNERYM